jgi:hypothetical protein
MSMSGAETKSCSIWTSGSLRERPARRTNDETVFLRLEISWFFAVSPMYLLLGPKPTSDLGALAAKCVVGGVFAYGVARLETSFAIWRGQYA